jgi:hypothetical protein
MGSSGFISWQEILPETECWDILIVSIIEIVLELFCWLIKSYRQG